MINYEEFSKVEIRVGTIVSCVKMEKSDKLYKLSVDFGPLGVKQILTGLQKDYTEEELTGLQTLFVYNLEPRKMMGLESQGMIMCAGLDRDKRPALIKLSEPKENGDGVN